MAEDISGLVDVLGLASIDVIGHSLGGVVAYLLAEMRPGLVSRLIVEDVAPPFPSEPRAVPDRPDGPLPFDWAMLTRVIEQMNDPDPTCWSRLGEIEAETLIIAGGSESSVSQDLLVAVAAEIRHCELRTIAAGHHVHATRPDEFAAVALAFLAH
jgi:pimeloyl-ACP methyl ester carboxylesterase